MYDNDNQIADNLYELRHHGSLDFPFVIYKKNFKENKLKYISLHWHPEVEIVYVKKGKLEYIVNEKKYILNENECMMVNNLELHGANMIDNCQWYAILFNPKIIYGFEDSAIKLKYFNNINFNNLLLNNLEKEIVKDIINTSKDDFYEINISIKLLQLYKEIYSKIDYSSVNEYNCSNTRVKKVLDFIYTNYNQKIQIDDLTKEIGLCRSEVCKIFKEKLHSTFTEFLTKYRIEKAIELLSSNEINVTQISDLVGFNSSSYFTQIFKQFFNMTPLEYRKTIRKS